MIYIILIKTESSRTAVTAPMADTAACSLVILLLLLLTSENPRIRGMAATEPWVQPVFAAVILEQEIECGEK